jgi:hypothetical protein
MINKKKKRNPVLALQLSLNSAKDYYTRLCEIRLKVESIGGNNSINHSLDPEEWQRSVIYQRALWVALIIEVGRLFDTFETEDKKVISFKSVFNGSSLKDLVDSIHGEAIISKIIKTRNTFTAHIGQKQDEIISAAEICDSKLERLLDELDEPLVLFAAWFIDNAQWENL